MTMVLDGSAGATFPYGSNPQAAPSKVVQVVNSTLTTSFSTSSASFVSTGLAATITPLFSTSKILVLVNASAMDNTASGRQPVATVFRGSTNLASGSGGNGLALVYNTAGQGQAPLAIMVLDSPATTSATTYTLNIYNGNTAGSITLIASNALASMILMEIAQ